MIGTALLEGLSYGLLLSILVGPMFFTIVQVGVERGSKAGVALAGGQWISDLMYITIVLLGANYIKVLVNNEVAQDRFVFYMGSLGSIVLISFGLVMLLGGAVKQGSLRVNNTSLIGYVLQGFLLNSFNPGPLFFWMALMSTALSKSYSAIATYTLFTSVMVVVILTDFVKVYLAKRIREFLKPRYVLMIRRVAGIALIGFGIWLIFSVLLV